MTRPLSHMTFGIILLLALLLGAVGSVSGQADVEPAQAEETSSGEQPEQPEQPEQNPNNKMDWGPRWGIWRGEIELPGGKELSFNFIINFWREDDKTPHWDLMLRNGTETLPATLENTHPTLTMTFPGTSARIEAAVNGNNTGLGGEYIYSEPNSDGELVEYRLPFTANCSDSRRFAWFDGEEVQATGPLATRWAVSFDERQGPAVATFVTLPDGINVMGTVTTPAGDDGQLAGTFENGRLRLSRFTGGTGLLYDGTIEPDGTLIGIFRSLAHHVEGFTASPDGDAELLEERESEMAGD